MENQGNQGYFDDNVRDAGYQQRAVADLRDCNQGYSDSDNQFCHICAGFDYNSFQDKV